MTEKPDAGATTADDTSASIERRFEMTVNFRDTTRVGDCMLELNKRGYVYTNSANPIEEWEYIVSGTVSGAINIAAEDSTDEKFVFDEIFALVDELVVPFGGECTDGVLTDRDTFRPDEAAGSRLTPSSI
jgi:hypothetical protein